MISQAYLQMDDMQFDYAGSSNEHKPSLKTFNLTQKEIDKKGGSEREIFKKHDPRSFDWVALSTQIGVALWMSLGFCKDK